MVQLTLTVTASDEIRVKNEDEPDSVAQKLVSAKEGSSEAFWSYLELLEIASYLHDAPRLRANFQSLVLNLGWELYHQVTKPSRADLVHAMKLLLTKWMLTCSEAEECIAPPSRRMLADDELVKVIKAFQKLQNEKKEWQAKQIDVDLLLGDKLDELSLDNSVSLEDDYQVRQGQRYAAPGELATNAMFSRVRGQS